MKTILEPIIALAAVVGIVLGGLAYFAKAEDLIFDTGRASTFHCYRCELVLLGKTLPILVYGDS